MKLKPEGRQSGRLQFRRQMAATQILQSLFYKFWFYKFCLTQARPIY
jgi:hypothetical protein